MKLQHFLLPCLLAALHVLAPTPGVAQGPPSPGPSQDDRAGLVPPVVGEDEMLEELRREALGAVQNCDYTEYIQLTEEIFENWDAFRDLGPGGDTYDMRGVPFHDPVGDALRWGSNRASRDAAWSEAHALAYQLEQVCNTVVQADEISRIYELEVMSRQGVNRSLDWIMDVSRVDVGFDSIPEIFVGEFELEDGTVDSATAKWTEVYSSLLPPASGPEAVLWQSMDSTFAQTMAGVADLHSALDSLSTELEVAGGALVQCTATGCRLAGPERAAQIEARLGVLTNQLKSIELAADARALEIETAGLMLESFMRRKDEVVREISVRAAIP